MNRSIALADVISRTTSEGRTEVDASELLRSDQALRKTYEAFKKLRNTIAHSPEMNAIEQMKRAARIGNAEETIAGIITKQLEAHAKLHEAFQRTPADELKKLRKASGQLAEIEKHRSIS